MSRHNSERGAAGSASLPFWSIVLRALRAAAGVATQEGWGARLGVGGKTTIGRWERGEAPPNLVGHAANSWS